MTEGLTGFMPIDRQLFPRRMAEALATLLNQRHSTAKQIARTYGIDPSTAENLRKGHLSVPTLEKVVQNEGWALWEQLGREIIGHSYDQYLQAVIEREAHVQRDREVERERVRQMEARAVELGALSPRLGA